MCVYIYIYIYIPGKQVNGREQVLEARFTSSGACSFRVWPPCWKRALRHPGITILITSIIINIIINISTTILIDFVHCSPVLIAFRSLFYSLLTLLAPPGPPLGALGAPRGPWGVPPGPPWEPLGAPRGPWGVPGVTLEVSGGSFWEAWSFFLVF